MFVAVFLIVAVIMTVYESTKELIFKGTLSPWQSHTITIIVTSLLATFAAVVIRFWSDDLLKKEQVVKLEQQKAYTLTLILKAVYHIVNNFLNHFNLVKVDLQNSGTVKQETLDILDKGIQDVSQQLKILEELHDPDKEESYKDIFPK